MGFIIGGGRPDHVKETFLIKDSLGFTTSTEQYVRGNPELFRYLGHTRINSTIVHTYLFLGKE